MANSQFLTTKEVARLCRVSDATVKRWEDADLLQSERTSGGHRRFRADEVARFQRENNLGLKICHGDESAQAASKRRRTRRIFTSHLSDDEGSSACEFFNALVAGCEEEATNVLIRDFLDGESIASIFDRTVAKAMNAVGELWMRGELSVAQEHLATRATLNAVHKLRSIVPVAKPNGKLAMCCAIEGDFHELPTHLVQLVFEGEGWEVLNFGANTPLYSFAEEILHHSPKVLCVSATVINDIERLSRDYREFQNKIAKLKIPIVAGGKAFDDERFRSRFPAHIYAKSFSDVAGFSASIDMIEQSDLSQKP